MAASPAFDKSSFIKDFSVNLEDLLGSDATVSTAQIIAFLTFFIDKSNKKYSEELYREVETEPQFNRAMRLLMVYTTMALTINDNAVYAAAVEAFPKAEIPFNRAGFFIDVLDHIKTQPASEIHTYFLEGLGSNKLPQRIDALRSLLVHRFGEVL